MAFAAKGKKTSQKTGVALHKALQLVAKAAAAAKKYDMPPSGWDEPKEAHNYMASGVALDLGASFGPGLQRHLKRVGFTSYAVAQDGDPFDDDRPRLMTAESAWKSSARTGGRKLLKDDLLQGKTPLPQADAVACLGWGHLIDDSSWKQTMSVLEKLKPDIIVTATSSPGEAEAMSCWGAPDSMRCREALDFLRAERESVGSNISLPSPLQGERYPLQWTDSLFQDHMELSLPWTGALRDKLIGLAIRLADSIPEFKGLSTRNEEGNEDPDLAAGVPGRHSDAPPQDSAEESDAALEGYLAGLPEGINADDLSAEDKARLLVSANRVAEWLKIVHIAKNVLFVVRFVPKELVDAQRALDATFGFTSEMVQWFQPEAFSRQIARAGAVLRLNDTITRGEALRAEKAEKARRAAAAAAAEDEDEDGFEVHADGEAEELEEEEAGPSLVWTEEQARSYELTSRRVSRRWVLEEARSYRSLIRVNLENTKDKAEFVQKAIKHAFPHTVEDPDSEASQMLTQLEGVPDMLDGMLGHLKEEYSRLGRLVKEAHKGVVGLDEEAEANKESEKRAKEEEKRAKEEAERQKAMATGKRPPPKTASEPGSTVEIPAVSSTKDPSKATLEPDGGQTGGRAVETLPGTEDESGEDWADEEDGGNGLPMSPAPGKSVVEQIEEKLAEVVDPDLPRVARIPSSTELAAAFSSGDMLSVHRLLLLGLISLEQKEAEWLGASVSAGDTEGLQRVQEKLRQLHRFSGDVLHYLSQPNMTIGHLALADPWTRAASTLIRMLRVTSGSVQQGLYDAAGTARAVSDLSGEPTAVAQLLLIYSMYNDARVNAEQLWPQRAGLADAWAHTQVELASSGAMAHPTFARRLRETISEVMALRPRWANDRTQAVMNTLRTKANARTKKQLKQLKGLAAKMDPRAVVGAVQQFVENSANISPASMEVLAQLDKAREIAKSVVLDVTERASPPRVLGFVDRKGEVELSKYMPMHRQETPLSAGLVQSTRPWLPAFAHKHEPHFLMPYAFPAAERLFRRAYAGHLMSLPVLDGITDVYGTEWGSDAQGSDGRKLLVISSQWKPLHSVHRNFAPMLGAILGREPASWGQKHPLGHASKTQANSGKVFDSASLLFLESQQLSLADADLSLFDDARALPTNATAHDLVTAIQWARAEGFDAVFFPQVGMHAYDYLLATYRIAPVQISTYGHSSTTDMPEIDFYIGSLEGEVGTSLLCGLKSGKEVLGADRCSTAFDRLMVQPAQEENPLLIDVEGNATRYVVLPQHYKSESDQLQMQLSVTLGPLRKSKEAQRKAEAAGVEQHGVRLGLVMAQAAEVVLQEAAVDPISDSKRPLYVGSVDEVRTVLDGGGKENAKQALAKSILEQKYRQERNKRRSQSERLQLIGVGRALVSAANRFSERLILVDGLAAAFEPAPDAVASRPSASYRPAFMRDENSTDSAEETGAWNGAFPASKQPRLPSEAGGVLLAGGSRGDHDVLGDLLDGTTDTVPRPESQSLSEAAIYAGAPAEECVIVALAWTAVKMNADHLSMVGDALRMAVDLRNSTSSSPCTILRVFPGLRRERQLDLRSLAFDMAAGIGLPSIPGLRLEIVPGMDYRNYRRKLQESAFAIDSYPFTGCNSVHDLLYSGVPVVSLEGKPWRSRIGPALLARAGLGYLVSQDVDSFRQTIVGMMLGGGIRARARADLAAADLDARLGPSASDVGQWRAAFEQAMQFADSKKMSQASRRSDAYYEHYTVELSNEGDLQEGPLPSDEGGA